MSITLTKTQNENAINIRCDVRSLVSGHVRIENGDQVIEGKNKLTKAYLNTLMNYLSAGSNQNDNTTQGLRRDNRDYMWVYLGTDTTTPTNGSTTGLTAPIGSPTKCSSIKTTYWANGTNIYFQYMATFDPGSVSGTVGEMGLYLYCMGADMYPVAQTYSNQGAYLCSRYAVADSEFDSFTIDTTKPVVVTWIHKIAATDTFNNYFAYTWANILMCGDDSAHTPWTYGWEAVTPTTMCSYMVLGSDVSTVNTPGMTALTTPIGSGVGTKPTSQQRSTTKIGDSDYKISLTSVWRPGIISGTVGEIGLYLYGCASIAGMGGLFTPTGPYFMARRSVADEHFEAFAIDNSKNLVITWEIHLTFET